MPNTKSAIRRIRRVNKQTSVNKIRKNKYKSIIKEINFLITSKKKKEAIKLLPKLNSQLMKTAKVSRKDQSIIHYTITCIKSRCL